MLVVKNLPANAGAERDMGLIPGLGRSPLGGQGNPLQYSCLENSVDRGAWRATVHGVAQSWTWLSLCTHFSSFGLWVEDAVHYSRAVSGSSSERDASLGPDLYIMPHSRNVDVKLSHYNIWPLNVLFIRIIWESEWAKVDEINKCQSRNRLRANTLSQ